MPPKAWRRAISTQFSGAPDDMKFISSMTLFARVQLEQRLFRAALSAFNNGHEDGRTVALLGA